MKVQVKHSNPKIESVTLTLSEQEFYAIEIAVANIYIPLFYKSAVDAGLDADAMTKVLQNLYETFVKDE